MRSNLGYEVKLLNITRMVMNDSHGILVRVCCLFLGFVHTLDCPFELFSQFHKRPCGRINDDDIEPYAFLDNRFSLALGKDECNQRILQFGIIACQHIHIT